MHKSSKQRLIAIIDFAKGEIKDLQNYCNLEYKSYFDDKNLRRLVEKIIENITNATIDVFKIIINENGLKMPDSYAEIMSEGSSVYKLPENQLKDLIQVAKLRNILAHDYLDIKWEKINKFLKEQQETIKIVIALTEEILVKDIEHN